jgi:cellobiose phosphorylase
MSQKITRRNFVCLLSAGSVAASRLISGADAGAEPIQGSGLIQHTLAESGVSASEYYTYSPDGGECIILRPDTPAPWMNLLSNDTFTTWITQRGHIECALLDRLRNGLTNPQNTSGLVYVRDCRTGEYFCINSPTAGVRWECRHGLGYTKITSSALGMKVQVTYFVPRNDDLVVWLIDISANTSREVDVFSTVEWNLGDENKELLFKNHGGGGDPFTGGSQFNLFKQAAVADGIMYARQHIWLSLAATARKWPYTGFMASSIPPTSFQCVKQEFVGVGRDAANPLEVEQGQCSNQQLWANNEFPWGVFHHRLHLEGKAGKSIVILTGMTRDEHSIPDIAKRHANAAAANEDLANVKAFWKDFQAKTIRMHSPELEIDRTLNVWAKYQWRSNMLRSQTTGRFGLGFWSYGLLGTTSGGALTEVVAQPHDLTIVRDAVLQFISLQYQNTSVRKLYDEAPLLLASDLGSPWPPRMAQGPFQYPHSHETDNIYPIAHYVLESGDENFLNERVPYLDGGEGTVFEHIVSALKYATQGLSDRGLPRLNVGLGDWNDDLNGPSKEGKAESVMMGMELCYHLRECAELARVYGRTNQASEWMAMYERIKDACNRYAWDGEWYVRAFADGGPDLVPVGSSRDKEARIFLNTQSLAVISGVAEGKRARQCMQSVAKYLMSPYGPMLYAPAYTEFDKRAGIQSAYAPGWRNANIYFRPAGWSIIAACLADLPELAFDMYKKACVSERSKDIFRYCCEPYVYPENMNGPDHPIAGRAQFQWNLGEGTNWMWRSYVYYILGVRPVFAGLCVDPRIPAHWPGFKVSRPFRNAQYEISVDNPHHLSSGVRSITIDGQAHSGNILPAFADGNVHRVEVVLEANPA